MAWELEKVEDQRFNLIQSYESGIPMTDLCSIYGISRKTAYKWLDRYKELGKEGLKDMSRAPHQPFRIYEDDIINFAIEMKLKYRKWGPKKILAKLEREYPNYRWPCPTRLYQIFQSYHLIKPKRLRRKLPATHPLGDVNNSNDVWAADFKGWILTKNGEKCEPLTITDGFSRYLIRCDHLNRKNCDHVWSVFEGAFREYGLPTRVRTDNGPPFGSMGIGRLTKLSINLIKAGVLPEWINPGHPEENGRHERFHSTLKKESMTPPSNNLKEQIHRMIEFQNEYNFERPHEALNMGVPGDYYCPSNRKWDGILRSPEYDTKEYEVRKVCQSGCIWLKQKEFYIGQTLTGEHVALKDGELGRELYYGPIYLGILTTEGRVERPRLKKKNIVRRQ